MDRDRRARGDVHHAKADVHCRAAASWRWRGPGGKGARRAARRHGGVVEAAQLAARARLAMISIAYSASSPQTPLSAARVRPPRTARRVRLLHAGSSCRPRSSRHSVGFRLTGGAQFGSWPLDLRPDPPSARRRCPPSRSCTSALRRPTGPGAGLWLRGVRSASSPAVASTTGSAHRHVGPASTSAAEASVFRSRPSRHDLLAHEERGEAGGAFRALAERLAKRRRRSASSPRRNTRRRAPSVTARPARLNGICVAC